MTDDREYVTLDDLQERSLAKNDPAMFFQMHTLPILIDEVQYAPQLFSYIKIAIDNGANPGDFWLAGSQAFKLMELAQESLAGRIAILHMPSLSQHEIYGNGEVLPLEYGTAQCSFLRLSSSEYEQSICLLRFNGVSSINELYLTVHIIVNT